MKKDQVPQDKAQDFDLFPLGYCVTDEKGEFTVVSSQGWDALNAAYSERLAFMRSLVEAARAKVERGEASPLLFHMEARQFDARLLARYLGLWTWTVKRHLRPKVFARLKPEALKRYADFFKISIDELRRLPDPSEKMWFERGSTVIKP